MKKILSGCIALLCASFSWADNGFSIDAFTIAANEEATVQIKMNNDVTFSGFQFDLELPEGVSIKYDEDEEMYCVRRLSSRLLGTHSINCQTQSNGAWRIMVYNTSSKNIKGDSGNAVLELDLMASDQVATGTFTPKFTNIVMSQADETQYKPVDCSYTCNVTLSTTVTTLGYASFSWPKALDFTNSGLTAFIATSCNGSSMQLESVTKVPANTGLILKGTAGSENTYPLETTDDETLDDVSGNLLSSNTIGSYTVESNNIYVLSNLDDGKPGFYLAEQGIHVGQYKSYLQYPASSARKGLTFSEGTMGITSVDDNTQGSCSCYDLQGRRVKSLTKGVYLVNGKKRIVK